MVSLCGSVRLMAASSRVSGMNSVLAAARALAAPAVCFRKLRRERSFFIRAPGRKIATKDSNLEKRRAKSEKRKAKSEKRVPPQLRQATATSAAAVELLP